MQNLEGQDAQVPVKFQDKFWIKKRQKTQERDLGREAAPQGVAINT